MVEEEKNLFLFPITTLLLLPPTFDSCSFHCIDFVFERREEEKGIDTHKKGSLYVHYHERTSRRKKERKVDNTFIFVLATIEPRVSPRSTSLQEKTRNKRMATRSPTIGTPFTHHETVFQRSTTEVIKENRTQGEWWNPEERLSCLNTQTSQLLLQIVFHRDRHLNVLNPWQRCPGKETWKIFKLLGGDIVQEPSLKSNDFHL